MNLRSGVVAGVAAAVAFTALHQLLISNIWDMAFIMALAGALSGLCLAWTYRRFVAQSSVGSWIRYNATYLGFFAVIPLASVLMFDPVITVMEASNSDGPLTDLLVEAMPLTILSMVAIAVSVSVLFGSIKRDLGSALVTSAVLMLFLGLNLTIIGLVEFTGEGLGLVAGFMALIGFIGSVFIAAFVALEWRTMNPERPVLGTGERDGSSQV